MKPRFPVYIVSKGRADSRVTVRHLERMDVPFHIVVEAKEYQQYAAVIDPAKILILDPVYQDTYDTCDALGATKSKGPGPARNFAWAHAIASGAAWHWVMDDNIQGFFRLHQNVKIPVGDGTIFRCMEDFMLRYTNIVMGGPNYRGFVAQNYRRPPFLMNTRIYSCNLIRNDIPFRWRGRYNEDTDLSLRILKAGLCTIQFNAFLQNKLATQILKGGNTQEFYAKEGTLAKSQMQVALHPDVSRLTREYGRWHHHVDYRPFKVNKPIRDLSVSILDTPNDYGMRLTHKSKPQIAGSDSPLRSRTRRPRVLSR